jgi:hypothetical protein
MPDGKVLPFELAGLPPHDRQGSAAHWSKTLNPSLNIAVAEKRARPDGSLAQATFVPRFSIGSALEKV